MPAWGNHEWDSSTEKLNNYKGRFDFPNQESSPGSPAISGWGEDWYYFDYGKTRFIAHPEPYSGAWADWNTKAKVLMDATGSDPTATGYMANDFVGIEGLKKSDFSQIVSTVPAITTLILSADGRKLQDIRK
jgi:hypothetical protein